jgi:hypothetical protein
MLRSDQESGWHICLFDLRLLRERSHNTYITLKEYDSFGSESRKLFRSSQFSNFFEIVETPSGTFLQL